MNNGCLTCMLWQPVLLLTALAGCDGPATVPTRNDDAEATDTVVVKTLTPQLVDMPRTSRQPATVHADQQAKIFAKVTGYLAELKVDIGSEVNQGDVLAVISVPEMEKQRERQAATVKRLEAEQRRANAEVDVAHAASEKARANVKKADASLSANKIENDRFAELVKQDAVADRLLDEAAERLAQAEAEKAAADEDVKLAAANLLLSRAMAEAAAAETEVARRELEELDELIKYARLKAPFDGVVTARNVDIGDLVRETQASSPDGSPLLIVAKLDQVRVRVPIPERDAPLVDPGDTAYVTLPAMGGKTIKAEVSRIARGLDESTRTMLAEIDLPNPDGKLLPGMFGQATIVAQADSPRLILPANVIRYDEHGKSYVYVVNSSDKIDVVDVTTGLDDGQQIEITDGLSKDQRVVAPMLRRLKQGQPVKVQN